MFSSGYRAPVSHIPCGAGSPAMDVHVKPHEACKYAIIWITNDKIYHETNDRETYYKMKRTIEMSNRLKKYLKFSH